MIDAGQMAQVEAKPGKLRWVNHLWICFPVVLAGIASAVGGVFYGILAFPCAIAGSALNYWVFRRAETTTGRYVLTGLVLLGTAALFFAALFFTLMWEKS